MWTPGAEEHASAEKTLIKGKARVIGRGLGVSSPSGNGFFMCCLRILP
jgi:hypothetical protein